jgi:hypothetical protein
MMLHHAACISEASGGFNAPPLEYRHPSGRSRRGSTGIILQLARQCSPVPKNKRFVFFE